MTLASAAGSALTRRALLGSCLALAGGATQPWVPPLAELAAHAGLVYGAAIEPDHVAQDPAYAELLKAQCRLITPENAMKWAALRPSPEVFDFGRASQVVGFAQSIGAQVRGHCLVWHEALPAWLSGDPARFTAEMLHTHISTVVGRYRGKISSWDVVNEWIERNDKRSDGLRQSPWLQSLGPDYIRLALEWAHAADPDAQLVLSDYGLEYDDIPWMADKRETTLARLRELRRSGAPLHGVGLQGHLLGDHPASFGPALTAFLQELAALDLKVYITEFDVDDQKTHGSPDERDAQVGLIYRTFLERVLAEPNVVLVNTWGLSDRYTSQALLRPRPDGAPVRPLPFDRDFAPKPAALAMAQAFSAAPRRPRRL